MIFASPATITVVNLKLAEIVIDLIAAIVVVTSLDIGVTKKFCSYSLVK